MRLFLLLGLGLLGCYLAHSQSLTIYKSSQSVHETSKIVEGVIKKQGLVFFETVNHQAIAEEKGVAINPMMEILFEDGNLSTALIQCQPTTALDLPLKILVWEENEDVYIAYFDPKFMQRRFMLNGCENIVEDMGKLLSKVVVDTMRVIQSQD